MPDLGQLALLFCAVFAAALGFACVIRFGAKCIEDKMSSRPKKRAEDELPEKERSDPKIYYIRESAKKPAAKKKTRKKPDFAFKDVIIRPERFQEKNSNKTKAD